MTVPRKPISSTLRKTPKPRVRKPNTKADVWPQPLKERELQAMAIQGLKAMGYRVLNVSRRPVRRCPHCNGWTNSHDGVTPGTPDLLARRSGWQKGRWIGIEMKTLTGRLRPEQKEIHEDGGSFVARSVDDIVEIDKELRTAEG